MFTHTLERKYSATLIVVNYFSDHPPISPTGSVFYNGTSVQLSNTGKYGKNMNYKKH